LPSALRRGTIALSQSHGTSARRSRELPTTENESPDSKLLIRIVSVIGAIFAVIVVVMFVQSAPERSAQACVVGGQEPSPSQCLGCHASPHVNGTGYSIRRVDTSGNITTTSADSPMRDPKGIATASDGTRYGVSPLEHVVWKQPEGDEEPTIVAGVIRNGRAMPGYSGDGGPASEARLNRPSAVAVDAEGRVYVADTMSNRVRRVNADGTIETVAGNGKDGFKGDGGPATSAEIVKPTSLAFDGSGDLLIAHSDGREGRIRRVRRSDGIIETLIGDGSMPLGGREAVSVREAKLKRPVEVTVDTETGGLYIAESRPVLRHWNIGNCGACHRLP